MHAVRYFSSSAPNNSKPLILLIHGYCGDKLNAGFNNPNFETGRYVKLAEALLKEDFEILAFDLSGHGENKREPIRITHLIEDVEDVYQFIIKEGYTIIGTVAYSLGGLATIQAQIPERKVGVFWSPAFYPTRAKGKIKLFFYRIASNFVFKPIEDGANYGNVLVDRIFLKQSIRGTPDRFLRDFTIPTLVLNGSIDTTVQWEWTKEAFDKMPQDDRHQFNLIQDAGHHFDKEQLNQFIQQSVKFLKKYLI